MLIVGLWRLPSHLVELRHIGGPNAMPLPSAITSNVTVMGAEAPRRFYVVSMKRCEFSEQMSLLFDSKGAGSE